MNGTQKLYLILIAINGGWGTYMLWTQNDPAMIISYSAVAILLVSYYVFNMRKKFNPREREDWRRK